MQQRLSKIHPPSPAPISANEAATSIKHNEALVSAVPPTSSTSWNEPHELLQTNALYSLLENRYATANPMPQILRRPSSNPEHYDILLRELEEAPGRSWLGGFVKRVKGALRFS
jgi:cytochrome b pre-mRNA-processing protein 6